VNSRSVFLALGFLAGIFTSPVFAADSKADAMSGAVLFRDKGCAHCHGAHGEGTQKGPALADIRKNKMWTAAKITEQILNGGQKMPPFSDSLSDPEVAQIVTFLRAKHWPVPPPAATPTS
jgi:mono/diheme cytochrome c family protein